MREFVRGREQVEEAGRSGQPPDFSCHLGIQDALKEMPNVSVRRVAEITDYSLSTVFSVLTFVLRLKFRHGKWIRTFDRMRTKGGAPMARSLEISLVKAQQ
jgi:hypothetical protein